MKPELAAFPEKPRSRWQLAGEQLNFLGYELRQQTDGKPIRWLVIFLNPARA